MNKLVSKNPIQKFKQGKIIQKFERGGQNNYKERFPGEKTFYKIFTPYNIALGALKAISLKNTIEKGIINNITIPAFKGIITNSQQTPQQTFQNTSQKSIQVSDPKSDPEVQKYLNRVAQSHFTAKPTKPVVTPTTKKNNSNKRITPIDNYYVKGYGEGLQNEIARLGGVRAMQNKLIRLGLLNDRFGADGKWGKNTQAAYEAYKKIAFNPQTIPAVESIEKTPNYMDSPINNSQVNLAGIAKQYLYAKQGGQLSSKNLIKRLKERNLK